MLSRYDQTTDGCSRLITHAYSTSFTLGIKTLQSRFHAPIYGIYGFVRLADEIVDTFFGQDQAKLLADFSAAAWEAIENRLSTNPVLHSFQRVVHGYGIPHELIRSFLESMALDLAPQSYERGLFEKYIYGSAESVGLMCLTVFCEGDRDLYARLEAPARRLGAAFQKVNFLRDIKSDLNERGRTYFPGVDMAAFSEDDKRQIETEIGEDFRAAYHGIVSLPPSARLGVYLAYKYYKTLFHKIQGLPASRVMQERVRVPDGHKAALLVGSYLRVRMGWL